LGAVTTDISILRRHANVHLLGRRPHADLPAFCKGFDVAINPFRINTLTVNANPLKVREYLAAGLPVVSTAIPEVEAIGLCRIGRNRANSSVRSKPLSMILAPGLSGATPSRTKAERPTRYHRSTSGRASDEDRMSNLFRLLP
jgi:hypothetical protein